MAKKKPTSKGGGKTDALRAAAVAAVKQEGDPAMLQRVQDMADGYEQRISRQSASLGGTTAALTAANRTINSLEQRLAELEQENARLNAQTQEPLQYGQAPGYGEPRFNSPYGQ